MELTRRDKGIRNALRKDEYEITEVFYQLNIGQVIIYMERKEGAKGIRKNIVIYYSTENIHTGKRDCINIQCGTNGDFYLPLEDITNIRKQVNELTSQYKLYALERVNDDTILLTDLAYEKDGFNTLLKGYIYSTLTQCFTFDMGSSVVTQHIDGTFTKKQFPNSEVPTTIPKYVYLGEMLSELSPEELQRAEEILGTKVFKEAIKRYKRSKLKNRIRKTLGLKGE